MGSSYDLLDPQTRKARYMALHSYLKSERASFDQHWRDLSTYIVPRRSRFWSGDRNKGDKRNQNIIDSTATYAARTLQSGMHAGLTSPARPWMKLTVSDPDLRKNAAVKAWLYDVTQRMLTIFATSNLYNVLPMTYGDLGVFGTAAQAILEDDEDLYRAYSYPIGSFVLGQDERGKITTFIREYQLTVRQLIKRFAVGQDGRTIDWSVLSTNVKTLWDNGMYETPVDVTWLVMPNEQRDDTKLPAKYKPWTSCYWEAGAPAQTFLKESGFNEFPIQAPRWDLTGEDTYGTNCPGMTVLGDVKQLQVMQKEKGKAVAKGVTPPVTGPSALKMTKTSLLPGDITYVDVREGQMGLRPIHEVNVNLQHLVQDMGETQYRIQRGFYEDLFLMLARSDDAGGVQPITAREVDERHEEKLLALGPVLERTNDELLDPIVDRMFAMMLRRGMIPPPPAPLRGVKLKVEYISIMAQAQKIVGVGAQDRLLQTAIGMVQVWPEVREKIDPMAMIDDYAEMLGSTPDTVRSSDDANARMDKANQDAQAAAAPGQAVQVAQAAKAAAAAPIDGNTALTHLIANATGAGAGGAAVGAGG